MDGLADLQVGDIGEDGFGQILGKGPDLDLEQDVLKHAAIGLNTLGLADGFDGHHDGDLLVLGNFVKINVQHLARERVMLNFLHQRQPLGTGIILDLQVHQQVLGERMVNEVFHLLGLDLEVLGRGLPTVNDCGYAAGSAEGLGPRAACQRA